MGIGKKKYSCTTPGKKLICERYYTIWKNDVVVRVTDWVDIGFSIPPASIYLFKVSDESIRTMCGICLKLTLKTSVIVVSLLLILNRFHIFFWCLSCWFRTRKYQLMNMIKVSLSFLPLFMPLSWNCSFKYCVNIIKNTLSFFWRRSFPKIYKKIRKNQNTGTFNFKVQLKRITLFKVS